MRSSTSQSTKEAAFEGAGGTVGFELWRIENLKPVKLLKVQIQLEYPC